MLQTSLLTDRKSLGYNNICVAEIRDNAASGCGSAWLEHLVWDQGVAGSNPVTPTKNEPVTKVAGFFFFWGEAVLDALFKLRFKPENQQ